MKATKRQIPTVEVLQRQVEKATRQQEHQVTELVQPPVPPWARWEVLEWSVALGNWQHYGFARDVAERTRLADSIRALSGRVKYHDVKLVRSTAVATDRALPPRTTLGTAKGQSVAPGKAPAKFHPRTPAYRRALRESLLHWLHAVGAAGREADLPIELIGALREACKSAVKRHGERFAAAAQKDPLRPWGE